MKKLILTIIIVVIIVSLSIFAIYFWFGGKKDNASSAILAIPINSSFILKINDFHRLSNNLSANNHLWETLKSFKSFKKIDNTISFIDTLSIRSGAFNRLISQDQFYVSAHLSEQDSLEFIAASILPSQISKSDIFDLIIDYEKFGIVSKEYRYNHAMITSIIDPSNSLSLFISYFRGVLICSSSKSLIESSIDQLDSNSSLLNNPSFCSISNTAGSKVDANLFINNHHIPSILKNLFIKEFQNSLSSLSDFANWYVLDITVNEDNLSFNGFAQTSDTTNFYLKVLSHQQPVDNKLSYVIPSQAAAVINLGVSDLDLFLEDYRAYLDKAGRISDYTSGISSANKALGINIHEFYRSFFSKEIALAFIPFDGTETADCWFTIIRTNSQSQTKQAFSNLIDDFAKNNQMQKSSFKTSYKIDKNKSADIYKLPIVGINKILFGNLFSNSSDEYCTFIDNYIVFGASVDALSRFIQENVHNKLMRLDVSYREFSNVLAAESNYFIYLNPTRSEKLYNTYLDSSLLSNLNRNRAAINKIQGISLQMNGGSNMIFSSVNIKYSPSIVEDIPSAWETRLDTTFTMKPQILKNHYTKSVEIVVQDLKNKLFLINDAGRILWSKQLKESIIGDITQVDLFMNGKLQYLFNTKNYLFAIDRNGEFVEGFPVKLKAKATNPVAVLDYENNREYRFLIACSDKKVYAYNSKGKQISGWSLFKTEKIVPNKIQHFNVKGKDYIVLADQNRIYILDRKGEERVKFIRYFSKSINSCFTLESATKNHADRLVTTDSLGLIRFVYLNGTVEDLGIKVFSSKHAFKYLDIDSDGENDFIFLDGNQLYTYSQSKKPIFQFTFDSNVIPCIQDFCFGASNNKIGFSSNTGNQIYLLNGNGSLYDGFPLRGSSLFSIGQLSDKQNKFNLFVASQSGLLVNYNIK